jgi:fructokinase
VSVIVGIGEILWDVFPTEAHLGGAPANFACHAAALGDDAWIVSAVGHDELGDRALRELKAKGVHCDAVARSDRPTGRVDVTIDAEGKASYEFAPDCAWDHLHTEGEQELEQHCAAVCFGSLGQRSSRSRGTIRDFVSDAQGALRVFDVNLRQQFYDRDVIVASLQLASAVKLNEDELPVIAELCQLPIDDQRVMLRGLLAAFDLRLAALT